MKHGKTKLKSNGMELKDKILKIIKDNQSYVGDDIYFLENALLEDAYEKVADEIAKLLESDD